VSVELVHIGFGSVVAINRVMAVVSPDSAPVKRMVQQARQEGRAIDVTYGRKTKAVIVLDNGYLVLAAIQPETIVGRLAQQRAGQSEHDNAK
jgi:extracellular matrix regulatory protein A